MTLTKKILPLAALIAVALPGTALAAPKPKVQLSSPAYAAAENSGSATITVVRPRNGHSKVRLGQPVTVDYTTIDGTAKAGTDYTATSGTLSFPACPNSPAADDVCLKQTVSVPVIDNFLADGPRTFSFKLSNAHSPTRRAILGFPSSAAVVIADDDTSGVGSGSTFQVASASDYVSEADPSGSASVFVIRSGDLTSGAAVHYASSDGTAIAGTDYTAVSGTLNFPTQAANPVTSIIQVVNVPLLPNPETEPAIRDFNVALDIPSGSNGALGTPSSENIGIVNSNGPATLLWAAPSYSVSEKAGSVRLTAIAAGSITGDEEVDVDYRTADGTAVSGVNYTAASDTLEFFADDFAEAVDIAVIDDGRSGDKAFTANLANPSGGSVGNPGSATVNVLDAGDRSNEVIPTAGGTGTGTGTGTDGSQPTQVVLGARQTACGLTIKATKKQKLLKQKVLKLKLRSAQGCKVTLTTVIKQLKSKKGARSAKALRFKGKKASLTLQPNKAKTVKVKFTKKTLKAIKKALRAHKKLVATVVLTSKDSASKVTRKTLRITIKR